MSEPEDFDDEDTQGDEEWWPCDCGCEQEYNWYEDEWDEPTDEWYDEEIPNDELGGEA